PEQPGRLEGAEASAGESRHVGDEAMSMEERIVRPALAVVEAGDDEALALRSDPDRPASPRDGRAGEGGRRLEVGEGVVDGSPLDRREGVTDIRGADGPQDGPALGRTEDHVVAETGGRDATVVPQAGYLGGRDLPPAPPGGDGRHEEAPVGGANRLRAQELAEAGPHVVRRAELPAGVGVLCQPPEFGAFDGPTADRPGTDPEGVGGRRGVHRWQPGSLASFLGAERKAPAPEERGVVGRVSAFEEPAEGSGIDHARLAETLGEVTPPASGCV